MRRSSVALFLGLTLLAQVQLAGDCAPGASESRSPPDADPRLRRPVTLALTTRPLADAVTSLARQSGLSLKTDPVAGAEKATLYFDRRPAGEVMERIARHFDFEWKRGETGYRLTFTPAARQREEKLGEQEIGAQIECIRRHVAEVAELVRLPKSQLEVRRQELSARLAANPREGDERTRLLQTQAAVTDALELGASAALAALGSVRPDQLVRLRPGRDLQFSTFDGTLEPLLAQQVHEAVAELMRGAPWSLEPDTRQADVVLRFTTIPSPRFDPALAHRHQLALQVGMLSGDRTRYRPYAWMPDPVPQAEPPHVPIAGADPLLKRELTLSWPEPPAPAGPRTPGWRTGLIPLGEIAAVVHRETGLEVVADGYIRARLHPALVSGRLTVGELLDRLAKELHYDCKLDRGILTLRSRTHFRDRPAEVPAPVVARFRKQLETDQGPTLASLAALATAADEDQALGLRDYWGWYFEGHPAAVPAWAESFYGNRYPLRLWSTLLPDQKRLAETGEPAPLRPVPVQVLLFQAGLAMRGESGFVPRRYPAALAPAQLAISGFSLEAREVRQQKFRLTTPRGNVMFTEELGADGQPPRLGGGLGPLEPVGDPVSVRAVTFRFHLPGQERPLRFPRLSFGR